jgi:transposase
MAYSPKGVMDIIEIVTRWHSGYTISGTSDALGVDRKTVRRYVRAALKGGISREKPLPEREKLIELLLPLVPRNRREMPARCQFEEHRKEIEELITRTEDPLKPKTAFEVICIKYGAKASYSSFKRFIRHNMPELSSVRTTCRLEVEPGAEIQIDYVSVGLIYDEIAGRNRKVYAFGATLSNSRYKYIEYVHSQNQQSFAASHVRMLSFFQGSSRCIIIDNLKSGVIKPDIYDPELNPLYRELAEHYGTFIDTARVRVPTDKGKIERSMPLARELFRKLKTLHPKLTIAEANRLALDWCKNVNGMQIHGTTGEKPFEAFEERERSALKPLPDTPFEMATWKKVKVHPDQFIQFEKKSFSIASRYVGRTLWTRGTEKLIQIFDLNYRLVKQHVRTGAFRHTDWNDFPENVTLMLSDRAVLNVIRRAAAIGPSMEAYVRRILEPHAKINLRKALGIVGLRGNYTPEQLEATAMVANSGRFVGYKAFKRLLDEEPIKEEEPIPISRETASFMRSADYFIHDN